MDYSRADFSSMRRCIYGVGFHWTTETMPQHGDALPFADAVEAFDVPAFVEQATETGAGYVLFTATHLTHHLPCPHPVVDQLIAGRTTRRDLLMEIADGLAKAGIRFALYYNHGTKATHQHVQDPEWQEAAGSLRADRTTYYSNYCRIISWLGEHYGSKSMAFWFDGAYELDAHPGTPWRRMTEAAKAGFPDRLVCYNAGIEETGYALIPPFQDYWAGESTSLDFRPAGLTTPSGLPWHAFLTWHPARNALGQPKRTRAGRWLMDPVSRNLAWPPPAAERVLAYLDAFQHCQGVVTFNLLCYQDGHALPSDLDVMKTVKAHVRGDIS
jgi:hypothetical protein